MIAGPHSAFSPENQQHQQHQNAPSAAYLLNFLRRTPVRRFVVRRILPVIDWLLSPAVFCAALLLKIIRRVGVFRMPVSRVIFFRLGVFPIRDHYYEPLFNPKRLREPLDRDRPLPGINLNVEEQLAVLEQFSWSDELARIPRDPRDDPHADKRRYHYNNINFGPGDAEYLYSLIRLVKPQHILEIGCGFSTLMTREGIRANRAQDGTYRCRHTCIEPYEMPWLEMLPGVQVVRSIVETVDRQLFLELNANDILFIDSSHVIRPQGDVVRLFLEILPLLKPGVLVHIHDIFTPRDYPDSWVTHEVRLWTEQYLLEAFLTANSNFRIIGALNYLKHHHLAEITKPFPLLAEAPERYEPASLWLVRC